MDDSLNLGSQFWPMLLPQDSLFFWMSIAFLLVLYFHYLAIFLPILWRGKTGDEKPYGREQVSVVICARNERANLEKNLPHVLHQSHPQQDVVVVNDQSWDSTSEYLNAMKQRYPRLHVVEMQENQHSRKGKKLALTLGIKAAKSDNILLTDADCKPASPRWSGIFSAHFSKGCNLLIGFSPVRNNGKLSGMLQRCDSFLTAMQYLSWSLAGVPYMGVGRNLGYTRDRFFELGGFKKDYHIPAGDDDLFVNRNAGKMRRAVIIHPKAITESDPKPDFVSWIRQKKRHYSVSRHYRFTHKLLLTLYPVSLLGFAIAVITGIFTDELNYPWVATVVGLKVFGALACGLAVGKRLNMAGCGAFLFVNEYVFLVINTLVYLLQKIRPVKHW